MDLIGEEGLSTEREGATRLRRLLIGRDCKNVSTRIDYALLRKGRIDDKIDRKVQAIPFTLRRESVDVWEESKMSRIICSFPSSSRSFRICRDYKVSVVLFLGSILSRDSSKIKDPLLPQHNSAKRLRA